MPLAQPAGIGVARPPKEQALAEGGHMSKLWLVAVVCAALCCGSATRAATRPCTTGNYERQAQALIEPYLQATLFSGSVLVARDGQPVFRQSFGFADREWNVPNTPDTKFRIGSITKQFTATAILQLAEQGKLSIDDPVSKYYANAPPAWAKITIRHLLTHSSGIPSYTDLPNFFDAEARLKHSPEEIIKLTRDKPLQFEPGSSFAYDNSGYILLGYIIEKVSGQAYADYVQTHIFDPLGMHDSGYDSGERITARRASGYASGPGGWTNAPFVDMSVPYAAGSLYSTVNDLLIWDQALYAGKPLKPASLQQMFTDYGHQYGFGWVIDTQFGHQRVWHNGGISGFVSSLQRYPKDGLTLVVLSNFMDAPADRIATQLAGLCLGAQGLPTAVVLPARLLDSYVGEYQLSPAATISVTRQGDYLAVQASNLPPGLLPVSFYASAEGEFFAKTADALITFDAPVHGTVGGLGVRLNGNPSVHAARIDAAQAQALRDALAQRVKDQRPAPGSEAALRRDLDELRRGQPSYDQMSPELADATRHQLPAIQSLLAGLGALQAVTFKGVGPGGADIYEVAFANGKTEWRISMAADGKIEGVSFHQVP
jgi:D-alanyl-D-alanine carboxypeptidase